MIPICKFLELFITTTDGQPLRLEPHQRRILAHCLEPDRDDRLPHRTIVYSCPKKSGKTCINAGVVIWASLNLEYPGEIIVAANDLEQAQGRVFKEVKRMFAGHRALEQEIVRQTTTEIELRSGTTIRAIASEYAGAAGSNHTLASFDELWGYTSEGSRRLWDELTPVPTRKNSIRFISTYAGFEGESDLLLSLYQRGLAGEPILDNLPCWRRGDLFMYWDHEPRMPWQTPDYYRDQRAGLRPSAYLRLHENKWVTGTEEFITAERVDSITDPKHSPPLKGEALIVGLDASVKRDTTACASVFWKEDNLMLGPVRIWQPTILAPIDFSAVEDYVLELSGRFRLVEVLYDPHQFQASAQRLSAAGIHMVELPQTVPNLSEAASTLLDAIESKRLVLYPHPQLRQHLLSVTLVETTRGLRLAKEKTTKKIDAAAALSFAVLAAVRAGGPAAPFDYYVQPSIAAAGWDGPDIGGPSEW